LEPVKPLLRRDRAKKLTGRVRWDDRELTEALAADEVGQEGDPSLQIRAGFDDELLTGLGREDKTSGSVGNRFSRESIHSIGLEINLCQGRVDRNGEGRRADGVIRVRGRNCEGLRIRDGQSIATSVGGKGRTSTHRHDGLIVLPQAHNLSRNGDLRIILIGADVWRGTVRPLPSSLVSCGKILWIAG